MTEAGTGRRRWVGAALAGLAVLAAAGLLVSWRLLSRWSSLSSAGAAEAEAVFSRELELAGPGPAYMRLTPGGEIVVSRDLERAGPAPLRVLHLVAWEPAEGRLLRIDFPFWFVKLKTGSAVNLGTLGAALAGDWRRLDLRVSPGDLERRGPGLVLDHRRPDGARLLLRTD